MRDSTHGRDENEAVETHSGAWSKENKGLEISPDGLQATKKDTNRLGEACDGNHMKQDMDRNHGSATG